MSDTTASLYKEYSCNSIHLLNLFAWPTSTSGLCPSVMPSSPPVFSMPVFILGHLDSSGLLDWMPSFKAFSPTVFHLQYCALKWIDNPLAGKTSLLIAEKFSLYKDSKMLCQILMVYPKCFTSIIYLLGKALFC